MPVSYWRRVGATLRPAVFAAVMAVTLALFFRGQIANGFSVLFGDRGDGVIEVALLEHWFNVFRGLEQWSEPAYFFPHPKTLGYNDGYLLYGAAHSVFRGLGADPLLSSELVNITVKGAGFAAFFLALREMLALPGGWCLFGASLFTISHASLMHAGHAQLLAVSFAPILALLIWKAVREATDRPGGWRVAARGAAAGAFAGAWLLTAYYTAWFMLFLLAVAAVVRAKMEGRRGVARALHVLRANRYPVSVAVGASSLALLPFLSVYLPKARESGMHVFFWVRYYTPSLLDAVNTGTGNWMFGRLYEALATAACPGCDLGFSERTTGLTPVLLVVFVSGVAAIWSARDRVLGGRMAASVGAASVIVWALTFHLGAHTLWWLVYRFVPGAAGMRVVARYQTFLVAPAVAVAVVYLARFAAGAPRSLTWLLAAVLLLGELQTPGPALDRWATLSRVAVGAPPPGCHAFFVTAAVDQATPDLVYSARFPHNVDAMLIAELVHLPTVNGLATFHPPDWNFESPDAADYRERVGRYAAAHGIDGLCELDLADRKWVRPDGER